jgi:Asp-tRNA(Asn)/Glu-tRNA(Gln) amidotransferase A subunit family amidase
LLQPLLDRTARSLAADLRSGRLTATEVAGACLERIDALEPDIRAWAYLDKDLVLGQARDVDERRQSGQPLGPLHGLPVGVKDIYDTHDMPTEFGTPIHRGRRPEVDATLVARLRAAGAVVVGKTVTTEFAIYSAGPTRNPHDRTRTPGGSSSGSAAAVAVGMVPLALATQTNGSIIRPASYCGVVGYKPSLGLLPRTGVLRQSTVLDQPGLMARDVGGVALMAEALMGSDAADEQSVAREPPVLSEAANDAGITPSLAFVRSPYWNRVDPSAGAALEAFVAELGNTITVELPVEFEEAAAIHRTVMVAGIAEAFDNDYRRALSLMSDTVIGIIEDGQGLSAVEFISALTGREHLRAAFAKIAEPFDAIITPATTGIAPKLEQGTGDPIMATLWTLVGAPSLTLPLLADPSGMPLGVQLVGNLLGDAKLMRAAAWLERRAAKIDTTPAA